MPVAIPEPFASALASGEVAEVCDLEAEGAEALFGRGLARARSGRDREAVEDFEGARHELGDACRVQLGRLALRGGGSAKRVADEVHEIADRLGAGALRTQALHLAGLAESRQRNHAEALDCLIEARLEGRACSRRDLVAQVEDSLGMVHASSGRLDLAVSHYALSLVEKTLIGDHYGTAITLGNLGRVHLRAGRVDDAVNCFEADLEIARRLGDRRGEARVINDLGRCLLDRGMVAQAEDRFRSSLALAGEAGLTEMELFNRKDLALALMAGDRLDEAEAELERATALLGPEPPPVMAALLGDVRGRLALARDDPSGIELLAEAARLFQHHHAPDLEITTRLTLAETFAARKLPRSAESCLRRALTVARRDGYARHLPALREAMTRLRVVESSVEETERLVEVQTEDTDPEGYVLFESLGKGGFGEVFRAFDPLRATMVALKRLHLERLYDVYRRDRLMATTRLELEAASRIRHPGVARVHAVGTDSSGGTYVVQELIDGGSLRMPMSSGPAEDPQAVLKIAGMVANALQALHDRGVVHRDLKPENILLRRVDGSPVLVDFGIARVPDADDDPGEGSVVGTVGYMAPEQLLGKAVDGKADIYALGVVIYEWLAGRRPYNLAAGSLAAAIQERLGGDHRSLAAYRKDLDHVVVELVDRMLGAVPDHRPSAAEVAAACDKLARGLGLAWLEAQDVNSTASTEELLMTEDLPPTGGRNETSR